MGRLLSNEAWAIRQRPASGLNRWRGIGAPIRRRRVNEAGVLFMLTSEAIRLVLRQEQNHGPIDSSHHAVASTHDRRHAHAQALCQDADGLYSCSAAACRLS